MPDKASAVLTSRTRMRMRRSLSLTTIRSRRAGLAPKTASIPRAFGRHLEERVAAGSGNPYNLPSLNRHRLQGSRPVGVNCAIGDHHRPAFSSPHLFPDEPNQKHR